MREARHRQSVEGVASADRRHIQAHFQKEDANVFVWPSIGIIDQELRKQCTECQHSTAQMELKHDR